MAECCIPARDERAPASSAKASARGPISSRFGRQPSSRFGTSIARNGIEIAVAEGQPVRSVHEGVVAFADQFTGYGNLVIVEHGDGAFSLYGHLSSISVQEGARVARGEVIGRSGETGLAGGDHLHYSVLLHGLSVNPSEWWDGHWIQDRLKLKLGAAMPFR